MGELHGCEYLEKARNNDISEYGTKHESRLIGEETYRTNYRRLRDRILYTGGFRRLQDKTQVISANKCGDHRTRLTHSLEVEQIAVSVSDALGLNSDLVSAIAIGHDIGHTPFGHAVEAELDKITKEHGQGGFSHAVQSVKYLSEKIRRTNQSTNERMMQELILEGILKHDTDTYAIGYNEKQFDCSEFQLDIAGTLEMQVVYWADKVAYLTHDFEDFFENSGVYANYVYHNPEFKVELSNILACLIPENGDKIRENLSYFKMRDFVRCVVSQLIMQSNKNITHIGKEDCQQIPRITMKRIQAIESKMREDNSHEEIKVKKISYNNGLIINFSDEYRSHYQKLRSLLDERYICSPEVTRSDAKAKKIARDLFDDFFRNPRMLPLSIYSRICDQLCKVEIMWVVVDFISSMTDRYAEQVHNDINAVGSKYEY